MTSFGQYCAIFTCEWNGHIVSWIATSTEVTSPNMTGITETSVKPNYCHNLWGGQVLQDITESHLTSQMLASQFTSISRIGMHFFSLEMTRMSKRLRSRYILAVGTTASVDMRANMNVWRD
ncbi:hypothetical protein RF11_08588 [Thelohanellus kitauei]|uniref:Uncharacterized protein n=1 Tax=Thelohanellus kitauei TaxID=669202 RepID=A0A0C2MLG4_THEKT|nr:hypothetical protein RF11_08588 [Thelohanellus kitauei]